MRTLGPCDCPPSESLDRTVRLAEPTVEISVCLTIKTRALDCFARVPDAGETRRFPHETAKNRHSEVRIGDASILIADGAEGWQPMSDTVKCTPSLCRHALNALCGRDGVHLTVSEEMSGR